MMNKFANILQSKTQENELSEIIQYSVAVDSVSKFHNFLYIAGWFHHEHRELVGLSIIDPDMQAVVTRIGVPHAGVQGDLGPNKGFVVQILRSTHRLSRLDRIRLLFELSDGESVTLPIGDLITDRVMQNRSHALSREFVEMVRASPGSRLLDIGGRSRSALDRTQQFPGVESVVLDILPGENVDIVGDAHEMGHLFPEAHFDFVYSVSVFEHLAMPWKVVCEMNRVMKVGAFGLVHSHQTIGMHDVPWDFNRFSDSAWSALFNGQTGFELIGSVMDDPQYVVPFFYRVEKEDAERSAGFESSTVLFKKIGDSKVGWDVSLDQVLNTSYPQN